MAGDGGARVLTGKPQPVEIHHRGIWYSGELIGWRHESDGRVTARVRCVVDNLRHSTWKDLAELRLPDPANPPRREVTAPAARRLVTPALAAPDENDATRPHVLLAGVTNRSPKPAHATTPPPRATRPRSQEPVEAAHVGEPVEPPGTPIPLERRRAYLTTA